MKKKFLTLIFILTLTACGFKVVNQSELGNFKISEIATSGDKRINYVIKKKLNPYSKDNLTNIITIELKTEKQKTIKEKNINNEVTKYNIKINIDVEIIELKSNKKHKFKLSKSGEYSVASQYSQTLSNEKKLIKVYSDVLANELLEEIIRRLNAV